MNSDLFVSSNLVSLLSDLELIDVYSLLLQLPEKIYKSLDNVTRTLRFTLPFPMLAYPVYLVSL